MGIVEQELQTRMGGRSRQKVSGEWKNYGNGAKLVLIHVRQCEAIFLVLPFKNDFSSY